MPDQAQLDRRNATIRKILAQYDDDADPVVLPVVSLEDFFEGNWDEYSLAPNVVGHGRPPITECYRLFREIRDHPKVQEVLVGIHETPYPDDEEDFDIWPDSDTVYVLTSAKREEVESWVAPLQPTSVGDDWSCGSGKKPNAAPDVEPGRAVFAVWWD